MRLTWRLASNHTGPSSRPTRPPFSIFLLLAVARLSGSPFLASAQYVKTWPEKRAIHDVGTLTLHARDQSSSSRQLVLSSFDDFCLFGPLDPFDNVWSSGLNVVSWCAKDGQGTRLIPDGTLHGVTYVKTKDYVQVSGFGDLTKINWAPGDVGGQFDSSKNTPQGASAKAGGQDAHAWVMILSSTTFCFRACTGDARFCPADYDQLGCWFLTGNAVGPAGTWQNCESDSGDPPGVKDGKTYAPTDQDIPDPTASDLSACQPGPSVSNGQAPPPMYQWHGNAGGGQAQGQAGQDPTQASTPSNLAGSPNAPGSTTWVPVETCQPCQQQPVAVTGSSSSGASPASVTMIGTLSGASVGGSTEQVGVTQNTVAAAALATSPYSNGSVSNSGTTGGQTTSPAPGNDTLDRRDGETITKNGQCCHTTWTPSVIGANGGGATGTAAQTAQTGPNHAAQTSGAGSGSASGAKPTTAGAVGAGSSGSASKPANISASGVGASNKSAPAGASGGGGTLVPGNTSATNGTAGGNGTGGAFRSVVSPIGSLSGLLWPALVILATGGVGMGFVA